MYTSSLLQMRISADDLLTVSCSLLELEILGAERELIIYHESRIFFFIQEFSSARILGPLQEAVPYRSKIFEKRKDLENFKWSTTFSSSSTFLPDPLPPSQCPTCCFLCGYLWGWCGRRCLIWRFGMT